MKRINFLKNNIKSNETKRALVESIQKNRECIDYLENVSVRVNDIFNYSGLNNDRIEYEKIQWILFNMKYNTKQFEKTLKQLGGNPNAIGSFEWK